MKISDQLKKYRKLKKLSIVNCAEAIGVSQSTYRDWENGRAISGEPYIKISNLLGVSLSELFGKESSQINEDLKAIEIKLDELLNDIKSLRSIL